MTITDSAREFFNACETGKGWAACQPYCHDAATFACQADALAETTTLEAYTEWMKGLFTPLPDARCPLRDHSPRHGPGTSNRRRCRGHPAQLGPDHPVALDHQPPDIAGLAA